MAVGDDNEQEVERIRLVARTRGVSEYDVFVEAWAAWHGTPAPRQRIESDFDAYLRADAVPGYVRHHVRSWLDAHPEVLERQRADLRAVQRARRLALTFLALALLVVLTLEECT